VKAQGYTLLLCCALLLAGCVSGLSPLLPQPGWPVHNFASVINGAVLEELQGSGFEMLVVDISFDGGPEGNYSPEQIDGLKNAGKLPICYLSVGEAEEYRFYWNPEWKSDPPPWLGEENPNWEGNYKVRYWFEDWQQIILAYLDQVVQNGFSGIYIDIIDAFYYWSEEEGEVSMAFAAGEMIDFVARLAQHVASSTRDDPFRVIIQNGLEIFDYDGEDVLLGCIDGVGVESLFFEPGGEPAQDIAFRLGYLDWLQEQGKQVFVIDYLYDQPLEEEMIELFVQQATQRGFIPYVAHADQSLSSLVVIPGVQP